MIHEHHLLPSGTRLSGHSHSRLHVCVVVRGQLLEWDRATPLRCGPGTVRVSAPRSRHEIAVPDGPAAVHVFELPAAVVAGLASPVAGSVFLCSDVAEQLAARLDAAASARDVFRMEAFCLEGAARAVLPAQRAARTTPAWLRRLEEEVTGGSLAPGLGRCGIPSLRRVASRYSRHRSHVARAFREAYGRTLGSHARAWRLSLAASRLSATDEPIVEIALDLGFSDQAHFTRAFRARYGETPARWRRTRRGA